MRNGNIIFAVLISINVYIRSEISSDPISLTLESIISDLIINNFTEYLTFLRQFNYKVHPPEKHLNYEVENAVLYYRADIPFKHLQHNLPAKPIH